MKIKLIGLDLDRTTLNSKGQISQRTKEALEKAVKLGVHVVIATGRSFHSLPKDIYDVKGIEFVASSNGAEIRKLKTGEVIYSNCIDSSAVFDIYDYLKDKDNMIEIFTDGKAHISRKQYEDIRDDKKPFRAKEYVIKTRKTTEDIFKFMLENKEKIENINIFFESDKDKQNMRKELEKIENITVTTSMVDNLEMGGATTSKATALKYMADKFGILKEEIMCCGDSPNDIAMMKLAGMAVAVANATEEVKEFANVYTDSNDNDGVAKAIEKYVLNV